MVADARPTLLTVVITTHDRPLTLQRAVDSALAQTIPGVEVIVVDDGSSPPAQIEQHGDARLIRTPANRGVCAARNVGLRSARGEYVTFLDDDDVLMPHHASVAMRTLEASALPPPVAVVCGLAEVDVEGRIVDVRIPPVRPRGCTYLLEPTERGRSHNAKNTLVVPTETLRSIGGWNEAYRSRVTTELFLRLNPVCSIDAATDVTYELHRHSGHRLTRDRHLRRQSFEQLVEDHGPLFETEPARYADILWDHAMMSLRVRDIRGAARAIGRATVRAPRTVAGRAWGELGLPSSASPSWRSGRR